MKVSCIIPALNEALFISSAIASATSDAEVIVVDGGSTDGTLEVIKGLDIKVLRAGPNRGRQMDAGAACSNADVLLFLHADSRLPHGWHSAVKDALAPTDVVAGAFGLSIDSAGICYRIIERAIRWRSRIFGLIYGDQAIFVKKETFLRVGGYNGLALMEDVDCVKRLRGIGQVALLDQNVKTSARRWQGKGIVKTMFMNWALLFLYYMDVPPATLYKWYYKERNKPHGD
ncbi:MAG: TIGR04283 family arsenosugar biosynthesis glycosyltransferase [Deltaproteobacteria bacterium]|nr:TIGR04283 family arsenosugar biosynthesis glycosyltransferase [Deltaproteobacteria bacterium]